MADSKADGHGADAAAATVEPHGAPEDHGGVEGGDHGSGDHGHGGEALGPFDLPAWGAAALGIVLGLVVVFAFMMAAT